jgi:hypothetical protein
MYCVAYERSEQICIVQLLPYKIRTKVTFPNKFKTMLFIWPNNF